MDQDRLIKSDFLEIDFKSEPEVHDRDYPLTVNINHTVFPDSEEDKLPLGSSFMILTPSEAADFLGFLYEHRKDFYELRIKALRMAGRNEEANALLRTEDKAAFNDLLGDTRVDL